MKSPTLTPHASLLVYIYSQTHPLVSIPCYKARDKVSIESILTSLFFLCFSHNTMEHIMKTTSSPPHLPIPIHVPIHTMLSNSTPSSSSSPPLQSPTPFPSPASQYSPPSAAPQPPSPPPPIIVSPCAACKILRRRCVEKCVLAPYFPPTDPLKFTIAHRVFGASNIIKFLQVTYIHNSPTIKSSCYKPICTLLKYFFSTYWAFIFMMLKQIRAILLLLPCL